ncbi:MULTISPECIES: hypothetical protein [Sporanaerobacter]|uniref:Uncharacterized protein n=1 Tax=Sporanaerobacter acetigenes DSM 13106 TaxID=1123281 RepID=A0A1M5YVY7_9FIRM|nr:hypothetical protein [Sporanaerobacter acetigenes]SHI16237.1 hypothetical protein SAMN02745180_02503 [Sporanaerobacter acetigenes DSM 13106]
MKNNIKALVLHLIIVIVSSILLIIFVATGPLFGKYTTNIVCRLFLTILLIIFYIYMGTFLDISKDKKYDFFVGSTIVVIGIGLWIYTFSITGKNLLEVPRELSEYWILFNIYHAPFTMIDFLLGIPLIPLLALFQNLLPSFLMGCGLRYKRLKMKEKSVRDSVDGEFIK